MRFFKWCRSVPLCFLFPHFAEPHDLSMFVHEYQGQQNYIDSWFWNVKSLQYLVHLLDMFSNSQKNCRASLDILLYFLKGNCFSIRNSFNETHVGIPTNSVKTHCSGSNLPSWFLRFRKIFYNFHIFSRFSNILLFFK